MAKALSHDTWRNTLRTASPRLPHPDLEHVLTWIGCCACYRNRTFSNPDVNTRQYLVCNISHFGLDYFSLYSTRYIQSILLPKLPNTIPQFFISEYTKKLFNILSTVFSKGPSEFSMQEFPEVTLGHWKEKVLKGVMNFLFVCFVF